MSINGNRGFARFRKEVLISVAALAVVAALSATSSPASAMMRSFGGGGHAMGGFGHSMGGFGSMGGGFGGHSMGSFNRSMGGFGNATGGVTRSMGGLSRSTGGLSHARTKIGHATASRSNALASSHNTARQQVDSPSNAAARQPAAVNKPVMANNANRPADKLDHGRKTDDGGMSFRPGTEKKNAEPFNKTVDIERDYDTGRRRQWTFNDDGTVVETLTGTVSYGVTQATGVVRVDDQPRIKKKVQSDCSLLAAKVAALSKQLAWEQGVLAALGGAQNVKLSGTTSGVATSFDDPDDKQAAIDRMQKQIGITGQLLAMYTADLTRCVAAEAAAAAAPDGE
jgi:hypothetical protein